MSPLDGTALVGQLDDLLALLPSAPADLAGLDIVGKPQGSVARIVRAIEVAMKDGRQLEIVARVAAHGGEERQYVLDPLLLRVVDDELYLLAWSHARKGARTFKVARIQRATVRDERAEPHPGVVAEDAFRGSVKAWSGELTRVRVRIRPEVAWLSAEYPLVPGQEISREDDGSAVVSGEVAGLVEATRWVLSWGRNAEALAPPALREAVASQLSAALDGYADAQVRSSKVSGPEGAGGFTNENGRAKSRRRGR